MAQGRLGVDPVAARDRADRAATLLDSAVEVPGTDYRVGFDAVVGILPVAGDAAMAVCSLYVVAEAVLAGAPARVVGLMLALVGVDFVVGSVPVVGPLLDAVLRVNEWNVRLLERSTAVEDQ